MSTTIRQLTIADYSGIIRVWSDAGLPYELEGRDSRERMEREMTKDHCAYFGLVTDNRLIGVAAANWDGRRGWVNRLAIDPDRRGEGLAGLLIGKCEEFLREQGALVIGALIYDENTPSMTCFEKAGYICLSEIKYFRKGPLKK